MRFASEGMLDVKVDLPTPAQIIEGGRALAMQSGISVEEHDAQVREITELFAFSLDAARGETRSALGAVVRKDSVRGTTTPSKGKASQAA